MRYRLTERSGGTARDLRPDVSVILPSLLVGEYPRCEDIPWLREEHGVTAVVNLQDTEDLQLKAIDLTELRHAYREHGIDFHHLPVPDYDAEQLGRQLAAIVTRLTELEAAGHVIYLHCNAGMNRAPTAAIAFLHQTRGWSLKRARDHVKARRSCGPYMQLLAAHFGARG